MEEASKEQEVTIEEVNKHTENLFLRGKSTDEVIAELRAHGLDEQTIQTVLDTVEMPVVEAKKEKANKDMLYGALWCLGGIVLTVANVGYIFWGAIVFGAIRFFRGLSNS